MEYETVMRLQFSGLIDKLMTASLQLKTRFITIKNNYAI